MSYTKKKYFYNDGENSFVVEVDEEAVNSLGGEDSKKFEDFMVGVYNGVVEATVRASQIIFKFSGLSKAAYIFNMVKVNTYSLSMDYVSYLKEEESKNGGSKQAHIIATTKMVLGTIFADLGYNTALILRSGTPWGVIGAATASIIYDVKDIGGKTPSEWVGIAVENIINEFSEGEVLKGENRGAVKLGIGLQVLIEAQALGYILSMRNVDFKNYANTRVRDLFSNFRRSDESSSGTTPPTEGPASGPSFPPTNTPSKGPTPSPNKGPTGSSESSGAGERRAANDNQPSVSSSRTSSGASIPTNAQRASSTSPSVSSAKDGSPSISSSAGNRQAPANTQRAPGAPSNTNNVPTLKTTPKGSSAGARTRSSSSVSIPPVIIPMPSSAPLPTAAPTPSASSGSARTNSRAPQPTIRPNFQQPTFDFKANVRSPNFNSPILNEKFNVPSINPIISRPSVSPSSSPSLNNQQNTPWSPPVGSRPGNAPSFMPTLDSKSNTPWQRSSAPWYNRPSSSPTLDNQPSVRPIFNSQNRPSSPTLSTNPIGSPTLSNTPWNRPTPVPSPFYSPTLTPIFQPTLGNARSSAANNRPARASSFNPVGSPISSRNNGYRSGPYRTNSNGFAFNDPTWIYARSSTDDYAAYRRFNEERSKFATSFDPRNRANFGFSNFNEFQTYQASGNRASVANARARASFSANWAGALRGAVRYAASHVSPLVFDLGCDGVDLLSFSDGVYFDIDNDGFVEKVGWTRAEDGQLARDLNHNGIIDDITELFGDDVTTAFYKLSLLDSNDDRVIDENDSSYRELLIWQDVNKNGYSEPDELKALSELGISSISLDSKEEDQEIEGNLITESSEFAYADGRVCKVLDVHYHNNDMDSWYKGKAKLEGQETRAKIIKELREYIQYIFKALHEEYNSIFGFDNTEFRLSEFIRFKTDEYIEEVVINQTELLKKEEIERDFVEGKKALDNLFKVSNDKFIRDLSNIVYKVRKKNTDKQQRAKDEAIKTLQEKFFKKKEDVASRYIQKRNDLIEELERKQLPENQFRKEKRLLEKKLQEEENKEQVGLKKKFDSKYDKIKTATNYYDEENSVRIKDLREKFEAKKALIYQEAQSVIDPEIKKAEEKLLTIVAGGNKRILQKFNDNKFTQEEYDKRKKKLEEYFESELNKKKTELQVRFKDKIKAYEKEELKKLEERFRKKYLILQKLVDKEVEEDLKSKISEEEHLTRELARESMKALVRFYHQQKVKAENDLKIYIEYLESSIKEEAHYIYTHVLHEFQLLTSKPEENVCTKEDSSSFVENLYNYFFESESQTSWLNPEKYNYARIYQTREEGITIDPETLLMPLMRGYGVIPSLHIAMSMDPALKQQVMDLIYINALDLNNIQNIITNILYKWAGVEKKSDNSRSGISEPNIEARKVEFIERITGQPFKQLGAANFVGQFASASMQKAWDISLIRATKNLLIQGPFMRIFPKAVYSFEYDSITLNDSLEEILGKAEEFARDNKFSYDFWVQIGYILASSAVELQVKISELKSLLSKLAEEPILVGLDPFSLVGDNDNNEIRGTSGSDYIKGLDGDDIINAKEGSDFVEGGEGDDKIYGGDGIDRLYGDNGNDIIYGGRDRDFIYGGKGDDHIYGEQGDDHIEGGEGADVMDGGDGKNTLSYGMSSGGVTVNLTTHEAKGFDAEGDRFNNFVNLGGSEHDDYLAGDDQDNEINGEGGNDEIHGGNGNDHLFGAKGIDKLFGEEGDDILVGFEGVDHMDGGPGIDTVNYSHPYAIVGVKVDLSLGIGTGGYAHGDTYKDIENIRGSRFDDILIGNDQNNRIDGVEGNDEIHGKAGNDIIIAQGSGDLYGDEGDDYIISGFGNTCYGGPGIDTISYERTIYGIKLNMVNGTATIMQYSGYESKFFGFENAIGTHFDDEIIGDDQDNKIWDLDGDDKVSAGKGNDYIVASLGNDLYDGGEGLDTVSYELEPEFPLYLNLKTGKKEGSTYALGDVLRNIEIIIGTKFNDTMIGDDEDNILYGFDGDDEMYGGKGNDILSGGRGKNILYGEEGDDRFIIGQGENIVYGGGGSNTVNYSDAAVGIIVDLSKNEGKKKSGELDLFQDIHYCDGSHYDDEIIGDNGLNHLNGLDGDDYIDGGGGPDSINGGNGNNTLIGGSGEDRFYVIHGNNKIDGGRDKDVIIYIEFYRKEYEEAYLSEERIRRTPNILFEFYNQTYAEPQFLITKGVLVNFLEGYVLKPGGLRDIIQNIEDAEGTHFDDEIIGNDEDNFLNGHNGNDKIYGGKGNDRIYSGRGHSKLYGEEGDDIFQLSIGSADIDGGPGRDTLIFNNMNYFYGVQINLEQGYISFHSKPNCTLREVEEIYTTIHSDIVYDSKGNDTIATLGGNDVVYLSDGDDEVDLGAGDDILYLSGAGEKRILGGGGCNKYIIMPSFKTTNDKIAIIGDFSISRDKLDFSNLEDIHNVRNLTFIESTLTIRESALVSTDHSCLHIKIDDSQEIILFDTVKDQINESMFVFN